MTGKFTKAMLLASVSICAATAAMAQQPSTTGTETVEVTASRISTPGFEAPTPVTSISANDIADSGEIDIGDVLNQMPQFGVGSSPIGSWSGDYGSGGEYVNLRNLGQTRTLVMLDGQRLIPSTLLNSVDLNTLPSNLVQRVDVVTGGASAAWGSDAVAGVVNYILDRNFVGLKASAQYGNTTAFDYETYKGDIAYGTDFDGGRGHLLLSGDYLKSPNAVTDGQRHWYNDPAFMPNPNYVAGNGQPQYNLIHNVGLWQATQGGVITGGPLAGTQFVGAGVPAAYNPGNVSGIYSYGGDAETQTFYQNILASPQQGENVFAYGSYKLTDSIVAHLEGDYGVDGETTNGLPDLHLGNITVSINNPFLPASIKTAMAADGVTSFPFGTTTGNLSSYDDGQINSWYAVAQTTVYRVSAGFDGSIGTNWTWSVDGSYSEAHFMQRWHGNPITANLNNAVNAVTNPTTGAPECASTVTNPTNGCEPLDLFGVGVGSPGALAYIDDGNFTLDTNHMQVFESSINGTPFSDWAGPVSFAGGADWRFQSARSVGSPVAEVFGLYAGNKGAFYGSQQVTEGFLETDVPLAKDEWWSQSLDLNAAGRVTDYTLSGVVETWKAGLSDQVTDDYRLRTTYSYDIRAPNLNELFQTGTSGTTSVFDPLHPTATPTVVSTTEGNKLLKPEASHTFTGGVVVTPNWLPGLNLSVDYYSIEIAGEIASIASNYEVLYCATGTAAQMAAYCPFVVRNSSGVITQIFSVPFNSAKASTSGVDFELQYAHELWGGNLLTHIVGNYTDHNTAESGAGVITDNAGSLGADVGGGGLPKFHANVATTFAEGPFTATLGLRIYGDARIDYLFTPGEVPSNSVPWVVFPDLRGTFSFGPDQSLQLFAAIENFLNIPPPEIPFTPAATGAFYSPQTLTNTYDTLGRRFTIGIRAKM
jgi:iron complex outermembrane receptor protein